MLAADGRGTVKWIANMRSAEQTLQDGESSGHYAANDAGCSDDSQFELFLECNLGTQIADGDINALPTVVENCSELDGLPRKRHPLKVHLSDCLGQLCQRSSR